MIYHDLPKGWEWLAVGDLGDVRLGRQRSPKHHSGTHMRPYLRVANVMDDRLDLRDVKEMNFTPAEFEIYKLIPGDVLLNEGQSLELVGRAATYRGEVPDCCFQNTLIRFRSGPNVLPQFALLAFRWSLYSGRFQSIARWTTNIAHLGGQRLAEFKIPVPPLPQQHRIVAEIEKQLTRLASATAGLHRVKTKLKRSRASILASACGTDSRQLKPGWRIARVGEVGEVKLGRQRAPRHHTGKHMRPYLRVANVFDDRIDTTDVLEMNFTPSEFRTFELQHGDILLNEGQSLELVGRAAMFQDELEGACFQNTLIRFRASESIKPRFALNVFRSWLYSGRFREVARWTTNIAHLGASRLADMAIPLPPLGEQERIVSEVEARLSQAQAIEDSIDHCLRRAGRLRQSILNCAFSGRLIELADGIHV